jgi:hypothetical protein
VGMKERRKLHSALSIGISNTRAIGLNSLQNSCSSGGQNLVPEHKRIKLSVYCNDHGVSGWKALVKAAAGLQLSL